VVVAVGEMVSKELIGKRVLPLRGEGTWQEYVRTSVDWAVVIPDTIDNITAAQMYINPLTALVICREVLRLKRDDVLVVNACGSSIGRIIAQLAKVIGFRLIAAVRSEHHTTDLLNLGAAVVIDTSKESLQEAVANYTNGRGVNAAIDSIGGIQGTALAQCVQSNGDFLTIGLLSGEQINWRDIVHYHSIKVNIFHLRHWNASVTSEKWQCTFKEIITLVERKQMCLMPSNHSFPLEKVGEAVRTITAKKPGKIFL